MRKVALLLTVGFFLSAATGYACDGGKTCTKASKAKSSCVCHGKCSKASKTMASKSSHKSSCTDPKCMKGGHCTASKTTPEKS